MSVTSLLPNSGLISKTGGSLQGQNGIVLSTAPTTGVNSPASYIQNGITAPDDTTYWANTTVGTPGTRSNFYIGMDKMTLSPSGLTFKFRGDAGITSTMVLRDFEVWMRKEHNPSLVSDI